MEGLNLNSQSLLFLKQEQTLGRQPLINGSKTIRATPVGAHLLPNRHYLYLQLDDPQFIFCFPASHFIQLVAMLAVADVVLQFL